MKSLKWIIILGLIAGAGCAKKSDDEQSYQIKLEDIAPNGCLNLQILQSNMGQFGGDVMVRRYTQDVRTKNASGNASMVALKGAYQFEDIGIADYLATQPHFQQEGCQAVSFVSPEGESESYKVVSSDKTSITLQRDEKYKRTYRIIDGTTLEEEVQYATFDSCGAIKEINVEANYVIRWGRAGEFNKSTEVVSKDMLNRLKSAVAMGSTTDPEPPPRTPTPQPEPQPTPPNVDPVEPDPGTPGTGGGTPAALLLSTSENAVVASASELKNLATMRIRDTYLYCSPQSGRPERIPVDSSDDTEEDNDWGGGPRPPDGGSNNGSSNNSSGSPSTPGNSGH